jgi:hypothetical protein
VAERPDILVEQQRGARKARAGPPPGWLSPVKLINHLAAATIARPAIVNYLSPFWVEAHFFASCRRIGRSLLHLRLKWSNHKIGEMGETVGLCPEADLACLGKSRILRFQHTMFVEGYLQNLARDL